MTSATYRRQSQSRLANRSWYAAMSAFRDAPGVNGVTEKFAARARSIASSTASRMASSFHFAWFDLSWFDRESSDVASGRAESIRTRPESAAARGGAGTRPPDASANRS